MSLVPNLHKWPSISLVNVNRSNVNFISLCGELCPPYLFMRLRKIIESVGEQRKMAELHKANTTWLWTEADILDYLCQLVDRKTIRPYIHPPQTPFAVNHISNKLQMRASARAQSVQRRSSFQSKSSNNFESIFPLIILVLKFLASKV